MVKTTNFIKRNISIVNWLICSFLILGCTEEEHSAYGSDGTPPDAVVINSVENRPGGAIIRFTPPTNQDLLYIKGAYSDENGISKQVIVSSVIDLSLIHISEPTRPY